MLWGRSEDGARTFLGISNPAEAPEKSRERALKKMKDANKNCHEIGHAKPEQIADPVLRNHSIQTEVSTR